MKGTVLIAGGTGLIGSRLTEMLQANGFNVTYLSRSAGDGKIKKYKWDLSEHYIDKEAIHKADYIVNLAGANLMDKRWTESFKKEIIDSRTTSANLIAEALRTTEHKVKTFISASGISYYGCDTGDVLVDESTPRGNDFLSDVVAHWESSVQPIEELHIRTVKVRIGIVLSPEGGALQKILAPIKFNFGAPLGSGKQFTPWVHIDDVCGVIIRAMEDESMTGVYNLVAPNPVTNEALTKEIAHAIAKPLFLPNVPAFVLKMILGTEKAAMVLGGNKASSEKLQQAGYKFRYPLIKSALENLLK